LKRVYLFFTSIVGILALLVLTIKLLFYLFDSNLLLFNIAAD